MTSARLADTQPPMGLHPERKAELDRMRPLSRLPIAALLTIVVALSAACGSATSSSSSAPSQAAKTQPAHSAFLCIGANGTREKIIEPATHGTTKANWAANCNLYGDRLVRRLSPTIFYEPHNKTKYWVSYTSGHSFYVVPATKPHHKKPKQKPTKQHHHKQPATGQSNRLLCIYPGAGAIHVVSPLAAGTPQADWANACSANGGVPINRISATEFLEPKNGVTYKVRSAGAGGGWFVVPR
jgi:hypothetical protein